MLKYVTTLILILVLVLTAGTVIAGQDEGVDHELHLIEREGHAPYATFVDGRLNAYDIGAPVVVFYRYEQEPVMDALGNQAWNDDGTLMFQETIAGIEVLAVNPETSNGELVLYADLDNIRQQVTEAGAIDCCLTHTENGAYSLHYSQSGWFWVEAPLEDGKIYSFAWEGFDF